MILILKVKFFQIKFRQMKKLNSERLLELKNLWSEVVLNMNNKEPTSITYFLSKIDE